MTTIGEAAKELINQRGIQGAQDSILISLKLAFLKAVVFLMVGLFVSSIVWERMNLLGAAAVMIPFAILSSRYIILGCGGLLLISEIEELKRRYDLDDPK